MHTWAHIFGSSWFYALIKFGAVLSTGAFGYFSLGTEARDKISGKLTRPGKLSLVGIIVSTIIGVAAQALETRQQLIDRQAQDASLKKNEENTQILLGQIKKAVYRLSNVEDLTTETEFDLTQPFFDAYQKTLSDAVDKTLRRIRKNGSRSANVQTLFPSTTIVLEPDRTGAVQPVALTLRAQSPFMPPASDKVSEPLTNCIQRIVIWRDSDTDKRLELVAKDSELELQYFPSTHLLNKVCTSRKVSYLNEGNFSSFLELPDAQVQITPHMSKSVFDTRVGRVVKQSQKEDLTLDFSDGREIDIGLKPKLDFIAWIGTIPNVYLGGIPIE